MVGIGVFLSSRCLDVAKRFFLFSFFLGFNFMNKYTHVVLLFLLKTMWAAEIDV